MNELVIGFGPAARLRRAKREKRPPTREWMALMVPGWKPAPLGIDEARAFMSRRKAPPR